MSPTIGIAVAVFETEKTHENWWYLSLMIDYTKENTFRKIGCLWIVFGAVLCIRTQLMRVSVLFAYVNPFAFRTNSKKIHTRGSPSELLNTFLIRKLGIHHYWPQLSTINHCYWPLLTTRKQQTLRRIRRKSSTSDGSSLNNTACKNNPKPTPSKLLLE